MKPSNDVFRLIKKMEQSEKRYFKRFASLQTAGKAHNSVILFDALNGLKEYQEDRLQRKIQQPGLLRNLASEKVYLYRLIMKSLRAYHGEKRAQAKAEAAFFDAHILYQKGLDQMAQKSMNKSKRICYDYQLHGLLLEILSFERTMIKQSPSVHPTESLQKNLKARQDLIASLEKDHSYTLWYDQLFLSVRSDYHLRTNQAKESANTIIKLIQQEDPKTLTTFHSQLYYHSCLALASQLKGELADANHHYENVLIIWDAYPKQKESTPYRFLRSISNYLGSCHMIDRWDNFQQVLSKIEALPAKSDNMALEKFKALHYNRLLFWLSTGELSTARQHFPETIRLLNKFDGQLTPSRSLAFSYNLGIMFFFLESYQQSLFWINRIVNHPTTNQRLDIQLAAKILQMVIHFELKNFDLLPFLARSCYRLIRQRNMENQFEHQILRFLRSPDLERDQENQISQLLISLEDLIHRDKAIGIPGLLELYCWLRARKEKRPMESVYQGLLEQHFLA